MRWVSLHIKPGLQPGSSLVFARAKPGDLPPGQAVEPSQAPVGSRGQSQTQTPQDSTGEQLCPAGVCAGSTATARVGAGGNSREAAGLPCYSLARGLTFQLSVLSDWAPIPPLQTSNYRAAVPPVSSVLIPVLSSEQQGALHGSRTGTAQHTLPELGGNNTAGKTKQSKARASRDLQSLPGWSRKVLKDL